MYFIESAKYKPPQYYVRRGTVAKWREGFVREALRQEQVIQGIMNILNKAGKEESGLMMPYITDIYCYKRDETVKLITDQAAQMGITPTFSMYDPRQIRILLEENQAPFSKIAYKNMGKNVAIRHRLQREFAQAIILGESATKMRQRVAKCTGQMIWQARRVARTERTRIQSQARWEAGQEAADMGLHIVNTWSARMVNTRDTYAAMDGQKQPQGVPFQSPSGALLRFPGDPSAPPEEVINCQCVLIPDVLTEEEWKRLGFGNKKVIGDTKNLLLKHDKNSIIGANGKQIIIDEQTAFANAKEKKRHGGIYRDAMAKTKKQLADSIMSHEYETREHEEKMAHPAKYDADWNKKTSQHKAGLLHKWEKDAIRNAEQAAIERVAFKERFGDDL